MADSSKSSPGRRSSTSPTSTRFPDATLDFYRALAAFTGEDPNALLKEGARIGGWFLALQGRINRAAGVAGNLPIETFWSYLEPWVVLGARGLEQQGTPVTSLPSSQVASLAAALARGVVEQLEERGALSPTGKPAAPTPGEQDTPAGEGFEVDSGMSSLLAGSGAIKLKKE